MYRKRHRELHEWKQFRLRHRSLFTDSGVPLSICESQAIFDDFLMHGYLDHHPDPSGFTVNELSSSERAALKELVVEYVRVFDDPGLMLFSPAEDEELRLRAESPGESS